MKLIFPNGEHPQAMLSPGNNRVGSASSSQVVLRLPGIAPLQCELQVAGDTATLNVPEGIGNVSVNGRPVTGVLAIRAGDLIGMGPLQARLVAMETVAATVQRSVAVDDSGTTRVRQAIPRFVLRGVSGAAFGKTYPVPAATVIGRQSDCDISVPTEEISRRHASVRPTADGLLVEDLGSANGTYINGKRVQTGLMRPGEELRLDTVRFLLVAPGMEMPSAQRAPAAEPSGGNKTGMIAGLVLLIIGLGAVAWYFLR